MNGHKFDVKKLDKLNNPKRLEMIDLNKIVNELELPKEPTLVDIGAGTGIFSEAFLNKIPNSTSYALDISKDMIDWMEANRVLQLKSKLHTRLMEENNIPLEGNFADLVFMITVHHELENSEKLLNDAKRVLKENGKILICDWREGAHHHFVKKESILDDLSASGFNNITEIDASEKLVCIIANK